MELLCPICGELVPAEQLVHELEGPPTCAPCAAMESVRLGPRASTSVTRSRGRSHGSFALGFVIGFIFCPALLGLFMPGIGRATRKGIGTGFLFNLIVGCLIHAYRVKHGLPLYY